MDPGWFTLGLFQDPKKILDYYDVVIRQEKEETPGKNIKQKVKLVLKRIMKRLHKFKSCPTYSDKLNCFRAKKNGFIDKMYKIEQFVSWKLQMFKENYS